MQRAAISVVLGLAFLAQVASAHSTLQVRRADHGRPAPAPSLQQILDGLVVSGPPIDANAPINIELWQNSSRADDGADRRRQHAQVEGTSVRHVRPRQRDNKAFLLSDMMTPADVATVTFLDNGSITVQGGLKSSPKFGFEGPFGFFVKTFDSEEGSCRLHLLLHAGRAEFATGRARRCSRATARRC